MEWSVLSGIPDCETKCPEYADRGLKREARHGVEGSAWGDCRTCARQLNLPDEVRETFRLYHSVSSAWVRETGGLDLVLAHEFPDGILESELEEVLELFPAIEGAYSKAWAEKRRRDEKARADARKKPSTSLPMGPR